MPTVDCAPLAYTVVPPLLILSDAFSAPLPSVSRTAESMRPPVVGSTIIRKLVPPREHAAPDGTSVVKIRRPDRIKGRKTLRSPLVGKSTYQPRCAEPPTQVGVLFDDTRYTEEPTVTLLAVCCSS